MRQIKRTFIRVKSAFQEFRAQATADWVAAFE